MGAPVEQRDDITGQEGKERRPARPPRPSEREGCGGWQCVGGEIPTGLGPPLLTALMWSRVWVEALVL